MKGNGAAQRAVGERGTRLSATAISRLLVAALALLAVVLGGLVPTSFEAAVAATTNGCLGSAADDQNNVRVTASHGKIFYIDSGQSQSLDAAYVSYKVENRSGSAALSNIWASLDTFTGGTVGLANPADAKQPLGDIAAASSNAAFFMLKATASSSKAQSHVVHVYSGKPGTVGATELYSCTFSFTKVSETIKAAANKVTSIATTAVSTIGSTMTITVQGNSGTVGAGNSIDGSMIWISPAARSTWPTGALRLEGTLMSLYDNNSRNSGSFIASYANQLRIPVSSGTKYFYTAVYTFRITGISAVTSASVIPVAQIASGTQTKHTDLSSLSSTAVSPGAATVDLAVTKSVSSTTVIAGGYTTLSYTISLSNTGSAVSVDSVTDKRDSGLEFVAGTGKYNGVTIPNPGLVATSQSSLIFSGPFSVPAGSVGTPTVRTFTYEMTVPTCTGTFEYRNTASATIGTLTVGSTSSALSRVDAGGTCGEPVLTTNTTVNDPLPIEVVTSPASSITTTTATVNGLIDPNGTIGQNIVFEVGTSPTLAGATSTTIGTTTSATTPYAVYHDLTGLVSGTVFYYRVSVNGFQGDILSLVTSEVAALPTATTTAATDVTISTATINGSVDPNQIANGAKVTFQYTTDSSSGACTGLGSMTTSGFVQSETTTATEDAVLLGSFPADVSYALTGLTSNAYYCYKVLAYYNAGSATWDTAAAASNWVAFRASVKTAQTITFTNPGSTTTGSMVTAAATASSALTVTYSSDTPDVCTVSGGTITTLIEGTCSITADQAGNDSYSAAAPVTVTFIVTKSSQTITFVPPTSATSGDVVVLTGTATSGLTVSYTAGPTGVCSIASGGNLQTGPGDGACTVTASQVGNSAYFAATDVVRVISVAPGPPVIITTTLPDGIIDGAYSQTLEAAGGNGSYTPWALTAGVLPQGLFFNTTTGEIRGTPTAAGTVGLTFTVVSALQTSVERTIYLTIDKKPQSINASDVTREYGSLPVTVGAGSSAGLPVTYSVVDSSVATVSVGMMTPVGVGATTVTASAAGNDTYEAAPDVTFTVTITPVTVTITASSHSVTHGDGAPTYSATYAGFIGSEDESVLTTAPGCTSSYTSSSNAGSNPAVTCSGAVAANYVFVYVAGTVTIGKATQTITVAPNALGEMLPGSTQAFTATSTSGETVSIIATGECGWADGVITATAIEGICTVTASVGESTNYYAATDVVRETDVTAAAKSNRTISLELNVPGSRHTLLEALTQVTATGRLPRPQTSTTQIGDTAAPGAPPRRISSVDTVDLGRGVELADSASPSLDRASRTVAALLGERFGGFAAGSGVLVEVTGARTGAQFVVSAASELNGLTITEAIAESRARLTAEFAAVDGSELDAHPSDDSVIGGLPTRDALRVFADAGLEKPMTVGQLDVSDAVEWVRVTAHVDGYVPGSVVYLAVTTSPIIVAATLVSRTGSADLVGLVPTSLLEVGGHNLRVVGIRQLTGITADSDGTVTISDAAMTEIRRFDLGTQATVRLVGANDTGGSYHVVRIVQLNPDAPWWTVILLGLLGLALTAGVALVRSSRRRTAFSVSVALGVLTLLPEVAGWLTRAYDVMAWGLVVGALVQLALWGARWVTHGDRRRAGTKHRDDVALA